MKKFLFISLLVSGILKGQTGASKTTLLQDLDNSSVKSNTKHFYASLLLTAGISETIDYIELEKGIEPHRGRNIIIAGAATYAIGEIKERVYDKAMGRGVFSRADLFFNAWGVTCGMMVKTCINDWRERRRIDRQNELEYKKHLLD